MPVPDVLAYLTGTWQVHRTAHDIAAGMTGRFTGTTVFRGPADGGPGLLHQESGTFLWQGVARPAERTLRFLPGETEGTARVEFADGRFFHALDLRSGAYTADHPCSADLYRGTFTVSGPDRWRTSWRVRGPAKDILLVTDYLRRPRTEP
jgi:hypothetical protein